MCVNAAESIDEGDAVFHMVDSDCEFLCFLALLPRGQE